MRPWACEAVLCTTKTHASTSFYPLAPRGTDIASIAEDGEVTIRRAHCVTPAEVIRLTISTMQHCNISLCSMTFIVGTEPFIGAETAKAEHNRGHHQVHSTSIITPWDSTDTVMMQQLTITVATVMLALSEPFIPKTPINK